MQKCRDRPDFAAEAELTRLEGPKVRRLVSILAETTSNDALGTASPSLSLLAAY